MADLIVDAHCHAWRYWPYDPAVPDPTSRGIVEQLLNEMDLNGVAKAAVVCARIDHNPDNNDYVAGCVKRFPDRLIQIADVDCSWAPTYHAPGAAGRLSASIDHYDLKGFTHYVATGDDGSWYRSPEGLAFFAVAEARGQVASISLEAPFHPTIRFLAERFPTVPFLLHHMAGSRAPEPERSRTFADILASAKFPNIYVKMSGFHYVSAVPWGYPYTDCVPIVRGLYEHFGPDRLCWGSDYPVVRFAMTYQHAIEAFRTHCDFIPAEHRTRIMGQNLLKLLER